jgi:hypothetical protein
MAGQGGILFNDHRTHFTIPMAVFALWVWYAPLASSPK